MPEEVVSKRFLIALLVATPVSSAVLAGSVGFFLNSAGAPLMTLLLAVLVSAFTPVFVSVFIVYFKVRKVKMARSRFKG
ncbi:MAG: hypothetical protein DRJ31_02290 [Candidatus Methanomethylicota archaeon]|uniref:Uncharacterized protein n=1 Tax=Thermoproteota archaeon TaxID=2056631 RepID=A0A497EXC3_9CREN|nr:MAG: hypothetical protein DRJ31_02290 [Candidatus Verstraetearchaeota archaeon]RLE51826.1 MAG: hypothetical protein DRJ33_05100 [Candidatus Verstraetearchaeota archaeon]